MEEASITVSVENGQGALCVVTATDRAGRLIGWEKQRIGSDAERVQVPMAFPALPAEYTINAFLLQGGILPLCAAEPATGVAYSKTQSSSRVTGIFVVPEWASEATQEQWVQAFMKMRAIGIDTVVIQYCFQNDPLTGHQAYFPFPLEDTVLDAKAHPLRRSQIGFILSAAKEMGLKVYLGLQIAEREWFDENRYRSRAWLEEQYLFSLELASALFEAYGGEYASNIAGWYLPFEFESNEEYHGYFQQLTEAYYGPLTNALKENFGGLGILISPLEYAGDDMALWQENLTTLLAGAAIDVIAPQDGIGFGSQGHQTMGAWFHAVLEAVEGVNETYGKSVALWGNCENYARLRNKNEPDATERRKPMAIGKFLTSLDMAAPYCEKLIAFSLHRWDTELLFNSAVEVNRPYYEAYKRYCTSGRKPTRKCEGYYVDIRSEKGGLQFHGEATAGLTDGFAPEPASWAGYRGIRVEGGGPFTMEIRFDDPMELTRVSSHYYGEAAAAIAQPEEIQYAYLVRGGEDDETFTYTEFRIDHVQQREGAVLSAAELDAPVLADGLRITVAPGGEWTFVDDIVVE